MPGAAAPQPESEPAAPSEGTGGETTPAPDGDGRRRVTLTVRATKDDLHTLRLALADLRDLLGSAGEMTST